MNKARSISGLCGFSTPSFFSCLCGFSTSFILCHWVPDRCDPPRYTDPMGTSASVSDTDPTCFPTPARLSALPRTVVGYGVQGSPGTTRCPATQSVSHLTNNDNRHPDAGITHGGAVAPGPPIHAGMFVRGMSRHQNLLAQSAHAHPSPLGSTDHHEVKHALVAVNHLYPGMSDSPCLRTNGLVKERDSGTDREITKVRLESVVSLAVPRA